MYVLLATKGQHSTVAALEGSSSYIPVTFALGLLKYKKPKQLKVDAHWQSAYIQLVMLTQEHAT
jgi:hypothetical protein